MSALCYIGCIIAYSVMNALRGSGRVKKVICYAGFAGLFFGAMAYLGVDLKLAGTIAVASFFIDYLCNSFGWGDFYPHGRRSDTGDFLPARMAADLVSHEYHNTKNWQTWAMSFRFFLTFGLVGTPILAYLTDWKYLLVMPLFMLSGPIYRLALHNETVQSIRYAEYANGLLLGITRGGLLLLL